MKDKMQFNDDTIDLKELFLTLLHRWWLLLLCMVIGGLAAFAVSAFVITPMYQSTAKLYVLSKTTSVTSMADLQLGETLAEDFSVIASSKPVLDEAVSILKEKYEKEFTREEIAAMLSVSNQASRILVITATSPDAREASMVANSVADATKEQMADITKTDPPTTLERAEASRLPSSPNVKKNTMMGMMAGFVLMAMILILQVLVNDHIQNAEDVEQYLGLSTLAVIPEFSRKKGRKTKTKESKAS